jgi:UDP-N-acetylmuramyl pentapeptide phosphotransferase/UDP-N-acetylglucosamine-1-phosphate transferase
VPSPPPLLALATAALLVPVGVEALRRTGRTRPNWRGREVAFPGGVPVLLAGAVGLELTAGASLPPRAAGFPLGVGLLGLIDDLRGADGPRGLRGHLATARAGQASTGASKALGTLLLAPLGVPTGEGRPDRALALVVLALATHAGNLLDLRPGRALKALALLGAALAARSRRPPSPPLPALLGPCLAFLPLDLRERAMLGDTGSGLVGAVAGLWLVDALGREGRALAAGLLTALAGYGEVRSISARVERTPGLRHLDSIGRAHA